VSHTPTGAETELTRTVAARLEPAHPRSTDAWADGFTVAPTIDGAAAQLTYTIRPAHLADTSNHFRAEAAFEDCAQILAAAGHPLTRLWLKAGMVYQRALIVFPAPEPEPEPVDPAVCQCDGQGCERAARRDRAVSELARATARGTDGLIAALEESSWHTAAHCIGGPESTAATLDLARAALTAQAALDLGPLAEDRACTGCDAVDCRTSSARARTALSHAERLTAVRATSYAAAGLILDRAHTRLTPGLRWRSTAGDTGNRLLQVAMTARAALHQPESKVDRRWRGERVDLRPYRHWRRRTI